MCGLAGLLEPGGGDAQELGARASTMSDRLRHRGPDSSGTWVDAAAGYAVGHQRLAVLDLSPAGAQPMVSRDGRYVLAFNGEVYDFRAHRRRLEAQGASFRGTSDTEVLLEAIAADGLVPTLRRVDGMFALALWDRRERRLVLARDKAGEKPLHYAHAGRSFVFGSELNALRAHPDADFSVDRDALALLVRLSYVPAPWSVYREVRKLPAGCLLEVDAAGRHGGARPYWSVREVVEQGRDRPWEGTPEEAVDELERLLRTSVRNRLESDVPLGAFLSGGLDSSTVAALAQAELPGRLRTYTVSLDAGVGDEGPRGRAVAEHLGTDHVELRVDAREGLELVPTLPVLYDEPFADPSQIPTALVCAAARRHVTVALSGDGGDELFGGYNRYTAGERLWRWTSRAPWGARASAGRLVTRVAPSTWDALHRRAVRTVPGLVERHEVGSKVHKGARLLAARDGREVYRGLVSQCQDPARLVPGATEHPSAATAPGWLPGRDLAGDMMYLDSTSTLPDQMLAKVDRASMAVGLEVRVPLLAPDVVAFAWRLPLSMKVSGGQGKRVLREVLARHVPPALWDRPKLGFDPPLGAWLRGPLRPWAEDLLSRRSVDDAGVFAAPAVSELWHEHLAGTANHEYALWPVLVAQQWLQAQVAQPVTT